MMTIMPDCGWFWNWTKRWSWVLATSAGLTVVVMMNAYAEAQRVVIVLQGNHAFSTTQLLANNQQAVAALRKPGQNQADADDLAYYLKQYYILEGYAQAKVEYRFQEGPRQTKVIFDIQEGSQIHIKKIIFQGEHYFSMDYLKDLVRRQLSQNNEAGPDTYVPVVLEQSVKEIRNRYLQEGFLHVHIAAPQLTFVDQKNQVIVLIAIEEGQRYFIKTIDFGATAKLISEQDRKQLAAKWQGQPYIEEKKSILNQQVRQLYLDQGYADVKVTITGVMGPSPGQITMHLDVIPGPQVTIAGIRVEGNQHVSTAFILKRVLFHQGALYSQSARDKSFLRLLRTGLFKNVSLTMEKETASRRVLLVTVTENPMAKVYVEPGWGNYELARLLAGYEQLSFLGSGQKLNVEGKISFKDRSLKVQLQNPDFIFNGLTGQVLGFGQYRMEPAYNRREYGLGIQFYPTWIEKMDLTAGYVLSAVALEVPYNALNVQTADSYEVGTASLGWHWDNRDNLLYPSKGTMARAGLEMVDPLHGQQLAFYRTTWEIRHYWSVMPGSILAVRIMGGLIVMTQADTALPVGERFFNGGENSVRSFNQSELGPKDPNGRPAGGLGFNTFNVAWRQAVIDPWYLNVFFDYGNISPSGNRSPLVRATSLQATLEDFFLNFRPGLGMGVQYLLPIGTARLEVAFNPDRNQQLGEPLYVVDFGLGTAF